MEKTAIIDAHALAYTAKHSLTGEVWEEYKTGVMFGFLLQFLNLSNQLKVKKFVFAWDSKYSLRKNIYPDYKSNRKKTEQTEEERQRDLIAFSQFREIRLKILPGLGFKNNFMVHGFEGDDVIASIVNNNAGPFVVLTSDNDLFQLLKQNHCDIYLLNKKKLVTQFSFFAEYGIQPSAWAQVKTIGGCKTDAVPGIRGIGEKSAIKYLKGLLKGKSLEKVLEGKDSREVEIYRELVTLPFLGMPVVKLKKQPPLSFMNIDFVLDRYGFPSLAKGKYLDVWVKMVN